MDEEKVEVLSVCEVNKTTIWAVLTKMEELLKLQCTINEKQEECMLQGLKRLQYDDSDINQNNNINTNKVDED